MMSIDVIMANTGYSGDMYRKSINAAIFDNKRNGQMEIAQSRIVICTVFVEMNIERFLCKVDGRALYPFIFIIYASLMNRYIIQK